MSMGKAVSEKYSMILVSSMEKVFTDKEPLYFPERCAFQGLFGENVSFQVALSANTRRKEKVRLKVYSDLEPYIKVRRVALVPSEYPAHSEKDGNYLKCTPGLYPDLLKELDENGETAILPGIWQSFWIDVDITDKIKGGIYPVRVCVLKDDDTVEIEVTASVEVIPVPLPKLTLYHTEWFHCDCLADYYKVESLSERHWEIMENFIKHYAKSGMNTILVPTFTLPLDTEVGGERTTVQLVDVDKIGTDYKFNFDKVKRFIDICLRNGIEYFEIAHLFTQWGANAAPKITANEAGELKKIFGWETDSEGEEYIGFLGQYIPALIVKLEEWGLNGKVFFHLSDEPEEDCIEKYSRLKNKITPFLRNYPILDAVSRYSFVERGIVDRPVPANSHLTPFLENKIPGLWTYYCCAQGNKVSNRFMSMPSARTRILGVLLYYFDIKGFLHWGYNFYNTQYSLKKINPYEVTDAGGIFQAGDPFLVYPGEDGKPEDSLRMISMLEAMQDFRALKKMETLSGREEVISLIEELAGGRLTMEDYPTDYNFIEELRRKINLKISRE